MALLVSGTSAEASAAPSGVVTLGAIYRGNYVGPGIDRLPMDGGTTETPLFTDGLNKFAACFDQSFSNLYTVHNDNTGYGKVYVHDVATETGTLLIASVNQATYGIATDDAEGLLFVAGYYYWKFDIDGTNGVQIGTSDGNTETMDLDRINQRVYVFSGNGNVRRTNYDGSDLLYYGVGGYSGSGGVRVDAAAGFVFYRAYDALVRTNLDGGALTLLVSGLSGTGSPSAALIDLDRVTQRVFYALGSRYYSCAYDGSDVQEVGTLDDASNGWLLLGP